MVIMSQVLIIVIMSQVPIMVIMSQVICRMSLLLQLIENAFDYD